MREMNIKEIQLRIVPLKESIEKDSPWAKESDMNMYSYNCNNIDCRDCIFYGKTYRDDIRLKDNVTASVKCRSLYFDIKFDKLKDAKFNTDMVTIKHLRNYLINFKPEDYEQ